MMRKPRDELAIGTGEVEGLHLLAAHPADRLMFERNWSRTGLGRTGDEYQVDRLLGILVDNRINDLLVFDLERKFFTAFACQRRFRRLAWFDLPAHEFPKPALRLMRRTLTDEIAPFRVSDERSDNFYNPGTIQGHDLT